MNKCNVERYAKFAAIIYTVKILNEFMFSHKNIYKVTQNMLYSVQSQKSEKKLSLILYLTVERYNLCLATAVTVE